MSTAEQTATSAKKSSTVMAVMQRLGRSLMLPIAVLPAAALLMRFGNDDMLGSASLPGWCNEIAKYVTPPPPKEGASRYAG
ncbi:hypothetical protein J7F03_12155 [Streptomyces sp. ISL-43]|nr:hypothetical protein [Streptomyces sp. ISL-43]